MSTKPKRRENKDVKIRPEIHKILKDYCDKNGYKIMGFVEKLIKEHCKEEIDIYGDEK